MSKIYVPELEEGNCVVIRSSDVIRVYDFRPTLNSEIHYKDYYPALNYNYNEGFQTFGNYSTSIPVCREASSEYKYHPDYETTFIKTIILLFLAVALVCKFIDELF